MYIIITMLSTSLHLCIYMTLCIYMYILYSASEELIELISTALKGSLRFIKVSIAGGKFRTLSH